MNMFFTIFLSVFLAEIGDKTQLATMLFSADQRTNKWIVFFASASALIVAAGIGVLVGSALQSYINPKILKVVSGIGFIVIGFWIIWSR